MSEIRRLTVFIGSEPKVEATVASRGFKVNNIVFSSAILCLSPLTESPRNKAIDITLNHIVAGFGVDYEFKLTDVSNKLNENGIPLRFEEFRKYL